MGKREQSPIIILAPGAGGGSYEQLLRESGFGASGKKKTPKTKLKKSQAKEKDTRSFKERREAAQKKCGYAALAGVVGCVGIHSWAWSGASEVSDDACTDETSQLIVVDTPNILQQGIRNAEQIVFDYEAPDAGDALQVFSVGSLIRTLEYERSYVMSEVAFLSDNRNVQSTEGRPLLATDEEGNVVKDFQPGVYCVNVPGPIMDGTAIVQDTSTTLSSFAEITNRSVADLQALNPHLDEFDAETPLPEGTTLAYQKRQGDFVLQHDDADDDTDAFFEYRIKDGKENRKLHNQISWANRYMEGMSYSGQIYNGSNYLYHPYAGDPSSGFDVDSLPSSKAAFYQENADISPQDVLDAYIDTPLAVPEFEQNPALDDEEKFDQNVRTRAINEMVGNGVPKEYAKLIFKYSKQNDVNPFHLAALVTQESAYKADARSHKGARGLAQIMPGTFQELVDKGVIEEGSDMYDPETSIKGGAYYIDYCRKVLADQGIKNNFAAALGAYNGGPFYKDRNSAGVPNKTESLDYVVKVGGYIRSWGWKVEDDSFSDMVERYKNQKPKIISAGEIVSETDSGVPLPATVGNVVYRSQHDKRWADKPYNDPGRTTNRTMATSSCGPTTLSSVITQLTGREVLPTEMAKWSIDNGYRYSGGTGSGAYIDGPREFGLKTEKTEAPDEAAITEVVESGGMVILSGQDTDPNLPFTSGGHVIAVRGVDSEGKWAVMDPNSISKSKKLFEPEDILSHTRYAVAVEKPSKA